MLACFGKRADGIFLSGFLNAFLNARPFLACSGKRADGIFLSTIEQSTGLFSQICPAKHCTANLEFRFKSRHGEAKIKDTFKVSFIFGDPAFAQDFSAFLKRPVCKGFR